MGLAPQGAAGIIGTHPCFDPKKDIVIPQFKPKLVPQNCFERKRQSFMYFCGRLGDPVDPEYSRGVRQEFNRSPTYEHDLCDSIFCLAPPGSGHSPRVVDSITHGCIPVIVQDDTYMEFEPHLDYEKFAVRIAQKDVPKMKEILEAISPDQIRAMQAEVRRMVDRFEYKSVFDIPKRWHDGKSGDIFKMDLPLDERPMDYVPLVDIDYKLDAITSGFEQVTDALGTLFQILAMKLSERDAR
ncbi:hypothetical protein CYMTET_19393 [Cymbomonas tetramitiformis]|uniref:Exostosin GT47 domain-containing protein n=1 Tax=Cymbomonas tetramitiformis TaxID=36881 RepID=A0AAE0G669_9CHLO|nr:hypothetical protein CYMTET_19393 [Cymbomonas tetramitiformis]